MNWKKMLTKKKKGIIYDFDGIIADTEGLQMEKWNILLKPFGIQISLEEYIQEYCGKSSATEIPLLLKKRHGDKIPFTPEEIGKKAGAILEELFKTREVKLMPDAKRAILFLTSLKQAVCSAANPEELEMKLSGAGINGYFNKKYRSTQSEAGGFGKPHPAMYRLAVKRLGLTPEQCIAFEDTSAGVQSAAEAGLFVIAMPNIYTKDQDFSMADVVIQGGWPALLQEIHASCSKNKGN